MATAPTDHVEVGPIAGGRVYGVAGDMDGWDALRDALRTGYHRPSGPGARADDADAVAASALRQVTSVVHDLRSPLASLLVLSESLERRGIETGDELVQRHARLIRNAIVGIHDLVNDLRDIARGPKALLESSVREFSLDELVATLRAVVAPTVEERRLAFHVVAPRNLTCVGHPVALRRTMLNLVSNALRFTDEGHVRLTIDMPEPDALLITVSDTGCGLPPELATLITAPTLPRCDAPAAMFGGFSAGMGLLLCRRLSDAMGGRLHLRSTGPTGTTFELLVPVQVRGAATQVGAGLQLPPAVRRPRYSPGQGPLQVDGLAAARSANKFGDIEVTMSPRLGDGPERS